MTPEERAELVAQRKKVGREAFTVPEFIRAMDTAVVQPYFRRHLENITSLPEDRMEKYLLKVKNSVQESTGDTPSHVMLTALAIMYQDVAMLEGLAKLQVERGNVHGIIAFTDMALGVGRTVRMVLTSDSAQRKGVDAEALKSIGYINDAVDLSMGEQANLYLEYERTFKTGAELLEVDPTGELLLDEFIAGLKGEKSQFSPSVTDHIFPDKNVPDFIIRGAEFFRDAYRVVYRLAKQMDNE